MDNIQLYLHKLKDLHVCLNSIKDCMANIFHQQVFIHASDSLVPKTKDNIASCFHLWSHFWPSLYFWPACHFIAFQMESSCLKYCSSFCTRHSASLDHVEAAEYWYFFYIVDSYTRTHLYILLMTLHQVQFFSIKTKLTYQLKSGSCYLIKPFFFFVYSKLIYFLPENPGPWPGYHRLEFLGHGSC